MRLSNSRQSLKSKYPDVWETLGKIQDALGFTDATLADHLGLTKNKFQSLILKKTAPNFHSIANFVERVGLSVDRLATGEIDYRALNQHASDNLFYLPERYSVAAFSRRRTSVNLLKYIGDHFDWKMQRSILRHFQMTEAIFSEVDESINFLFPADLCQYLLKSGYSESLFPLMGAYSVVTNKNTPLGNVIAQFGSPRQVYEGAFGGLVKIFYDRNCDYRILKIDDQNCWVEANFTTELKDLLKLKKIGNAQACAVRGGSFASLMGYLDLPFSEANEVACIHRGDKSCIYHLDYTRAQGAYLIKKTALLYN